MKAAGRRIWHAIDGTYVEVMIVAPPQTNKVAAGTSAGGGVEVSVSAIIIQYCAVPSLKHYAVFKPPVQGQLQSTARNWGLLQSGLSVNPAVATGTGTCI